ncbi:MAG: neutral/alkaline non-lysosomal ceramidase N-terminal domain-containing protein, partial [Nocardioides sp.]
AATSSYLVGAGIYDITGASAETGLFGYASGEDATGIQERLWSHAYVIASPATGKRVVFVSADMGAMFQSVKLEVVRRLQSRYGSTYDASNVMLTATHTHVGNSGQSHFPLYILASADKSGYGYSSQNFEAAVSGIVQSIIRAHDNLTPGTVSLVTGTLSGASKNRSLGAYHANADAANYADTVNTQMVMLKLATSSGQPVGMIDWFAVHPTSLSKKFTQLSGDNKGYAQYQFEQRLGTNPTSATTFVASFANSDEGDVVPTDGNAYSSPGFQGSADELSNAEQAGQKQFDRAWQMYQSAGVQMDGSLDYRHRWANFENYDVAGTYTGAGTKHLCAASRGFSFAAGAENGPSDIPGIYEGMTRGTFSVTDAINRVDTSALGGLVRFLFGAITWGLQDPCQEQKPNLLTTGTLDWVPEVLPFQVFRVGSLAIIAAPVEVTTMAGRRIRATVLNRLAGTGVTTAVIAGLANTYSGYLTTYEEFQTQNYEGASTEFGPYTLAAYQQEYDRLATALKAGTALVDDRQPPNRSGDARLERPGVVWDGKYLTESFGQVLSQPATSYSRGQTVVATFRGGHPKNNLMTMSSYLIVQRQIGSGWVDYRYDRDWDTTFRWQREGVDRSLCTVEWRTKAADPAGTYRLVQQGYWKNGLNGSQNFYRGTSRTFTLR